MKEVTITIMRFKATEFCTIGRLYLNEAVIGYTLEYPWRFNVRWSDKCNKVENLSRVSCVHTGVYRASPRRDPRIDSAGKYKESEFRVQLDNVPGREAIQIHAGNILAEDSQGCILVGRSVELHETYAALGASKETLRQIEHVTLPRMAKNPKEWAEGVAKITVRIRGFPRIE